MKPTRNIFPDRNLVIMGVTIRDTGYATTVNWEWHVSTSGQTNVRFKCLGKFSRGDVTYTVWISRSLDREPTQEGMAALCAEHHAYIQNPFGVTDE